MLFKDLRDGKKFILVPEEGCERTPVLLKISDKVVVELFLGTEWEVSSSLIQEKRLEKDSPIIEVLI